MKNKSLNDRATIVLKNDIKGLRNQAHTYFDMLWQLGYVTERNTAYEYLYMGLELKPNKPRIIFTKKGIPLDLNRWHIGAFTKRRCRLTVIWSIAMLNSLRKIDIETGKEPKFPRYRIMLRGDIDHSETEQMFEIKQKIEEFEYFDY